MLRFYWDRTREVPSILRDALVHVDKYVGIFSLIYLIALGLLSRPVAGRLVSVWAGLPLWLVSMGLLAWILAVFTWGLAKANFEEFQKLKARIPEDPESAEKRKAIKRLLGEAQKRGRELAARHDDYDDRSVTDEDLERWRQETYDLIRAAFGQQEAEIFLDNHGYPFDQDQYIASVSELRHDVSLMEVRLWRLHNLGREAHKLPIEEDFDREARGSPDKTLRRDIRELKGLCLHLAWELKDLDRWYRHADVTIDVRLERDRLEKERPLTEQEEAAFRDRMDELQRQHDAETVKTYHDIYGDRVMSIYDELGPRGWFGTDDCDFFQNLDDPWDIVEVGKRLERVGEKL